MCNFDSCFLVHLAHWTQFDAWLNDVVRRSITITGVVGDAHLRPLRSHIGSDGREVVVPTATLAAVEFVVGAVVAFFGVDDETAAGQGVQNDIDQAGGGNDCTYLQVSSSRGKSAADRRDENEPAQQKNVSEGSSP